MIPTDIEHRRHQLLQLKDELQSIASSAAQEEEAIKAQSGLEAHEFEDDAQRLDMLEKSGSLVVRAVERLARVERALRKIDEGTYGFSDVSGERIPSERLDATPEAVNTVAEQSALERR